MPSYQDGIKTGILLAASLLEKPEQLLMIAGQKGDCDCISCLIRALITSVDTMTVVTDEEIKAAMLRDELVAQGRTN